MKRRSFAMKIVLSILTFLPWPGFAGTRTRSNLKRKEPFKVGAGEARFGKHFNMKGVTMNRLDIKISGKDTDNQIAVFEQTGITPKGGPPLHIHPFQDEWFYVIEGEYFFQVGVEKFSLKAGETIFLPREIQHAFIQLTEKARCIVTYLPAGKMEAFFETTDRWSSAPSAEIIAKVFAEHEMKIVGPPLTDY